jgi:hypothetical protein
LKGPDLVDSFYPVDVTLHHVWTPFALPLELQQLQEEQNCAILKGQQVLELLKFLNDTLN